MVRIHDEGHAGEHILLSGERRYNTLYKKKKSSGKICLSVGGSDFHHKVLGAEHRDNCAGNCHFSLRPIYESFESKGACIAVSVYTAWSSSTDIFKSFNKTDLELPAGNYRTERILATNVFVVSLFFCSLLFYVEICFLVVSKSSIDIIP